MAADVKLEFDANLAPIDKKTKRYEERTKSLEKQVARLTKRLGVMSRGSQKAGTAMEGAGRGGNKFSGVLGTLKTRLGALVGVSGLLAGFSAAMSQINADSTAAAAAITSVEAATRRLLQISEDPEEFAALRVSARKLSLAAGIPFEKALDTTAQAAAAGLGPEKTKELVLNAQRLGEDPQAVISSLVTLIRNFPREPISSAFDKVLAAAEVTKLPLIATAEAAARSGPAAKSVQATLTETLALSAALIDAEVSVEKAATVFNRLAAGATEGGIKDKGVLEGLRVFREDNATAFAKYEDSNKEFGRAIASLPAALERFGLIEPKIAVSAGVVGRKVAIGQQDPQLAALERSRITNQEIEASKRTRAIQAQRLLDAKAVLTDAQNRTLADKSGLEKFVLLLELALTNMTIGIDDLTGSVQEQTRRRELMAAGAAFGGAETVPEMQQNLADVRAEHARRDRADKRMIKALESIETNTRSAGGVGTMTDQRRLDLGNEGNVRGPGGRGE